MITSYASFCPDAPNNEYGSISWDDESVEAQNNYVRDRLEEIHPSTLGLIHLASGSEHDVFYSPEYPYSVIKITRLLDDAQFPLAAGYFPAFVPASTPFFSLTPASIHAYFQRILLTNLHFESNIEILGYCLHQNLKTPLIISKHPAYPNRSDFSQNLPVLISNFMNSHGFSPLVSNASPYQPASLDETIHSSPRQPATMFWHPARSILIADASPKNFAFDPAFKTYPIDILIRYIPATLASIISTSMLQK